MTSKNKNGIILKFERAATQRCGDITRIVGLVKGKYLVDMIDKLNLEANPRNSKTGTVTKAIQESIVTSSALFPFKTKGILLAASDFEDLERGRIRIIPSQPDVEGILDGGHNTLAIGLHILRLSFSYAGKSMPRGSKTWFEFKELWEDNHDLVENYLAFIRNNQDLDPAEGLTFLVPIELLLPTDPDDLENAESFRNSLLEICAARNNNVQLNVAAKANQHGYFDSLQQIMASVNPELCERIEWKTNDGGEIAVEDIIALTWIPLSVMTKVKDKDGREIDPPAPTSLYSSKATSLRTFERLMSSDAVTTSSGKDYRRDLVNHEVASAFRVAAEIPELFDYIFANFPALYNASGKFGRITAVKKLNESRKTKLSHFGKKPVDVLSPEGFVVPLVYGLTALVEETEDANGYKVIQWKCDPKEFLEEHLAGIVRSYSDVLQPWGFDPQKVGKALTSYNRAVDAFKMALAGIL